ncbi:hypothetical protein RG47T_2821 [Mucilaginibacter polytrichastri]|uniref:Uncharacterized protein n=1 Tax=Mucilaginibacter polytrichastri TaxID=1302689 RepID=A0A1Q6A019_9SPHI|nr:hypothetical protein RG47T_2821 [Mucilaginibacter polytrichastri]
MVVPLLKAAFSCNLKHYVRFRCAKTDGNTYGFKQGIIDKPGTLKIYNWFTPYY